MEQRAPRLASAGKILGTLVILATIANLKLDLVDNAGISMEEYLGFGSALVFYITSFLASRERKIVSLANNLSLEEQFELLETIPTKSGGAGTNADMQSMHTKSIVSSIIGGKTDIDESKVNQAIGTLSSGEFGETAKSLAQQLPAPHKSADNVIQTSTSANQNFAKHGNTNIPLPLVKQENQPPSDKPKNPSDHQQSEQLSGKNSQHEKASIPDVSDLFDDIQLSAVKPKDRVPNELIETPELPNLDDLF